MKFVAQEVMTLASWTRRESLESVETARASLSSFV